ncbi:MAG: zinc-ribbon domain-containing protein [Firmicutes bacterium]|nr:zinc-ribbon domain-containing protein [Bacillota bacterium]
MHCTNCGSELPENVSFCPNCGTRVAAAPEPAPAPEPPRQEPPQPEPEPAPEPEPEPRRDVQPWPEEPYHAEEPAKQPKDTKAIISLVCGVIAAITMFTGGGAIIGIVAAIVGLIFGINARKENPSTMATVGIVLCALTLVLCALIFIACVACVGGLAVLSTAST